MSAHLFPHLYPRLRRDAGGAIAPRPYVPAEEPAHSPACYCAVEAVWALPCRNCVAEGYAQGGAS